MLAGLLALSLGWAAQALKTGRRDALSVRPASDAP
jgi:hypothetical protein